METQNQIESLITHLQNEKLIPGSAECRWDRASSSLIVQASFQNSGKFDLLVSDIETAKTVEALFQENLKAQFAKTSDHRDLLNLKSGDRYTLLVESEMGFGVGAVQFAFASSKVGRYAQYENSIELIFKQRNKRSFSAIRFYGRKNFAIFAGWIDVDTNPFGAPEDQGPITVRRMRYASCDSRFLTDAIASAKVAPLYSKLDDETEGL